MTAWCSNYAPLYDIPEECATGTSNGALTYYLYLRGAVKPEQENVFLQGEHMGRPSEIRSMPVSYTHLDVYKRQHRCRRTFR